jgi:hypothetical protein
MGRFIPQNSHAERVFDAVHGMFQDLANAPLTGRYGKPDLDGFNKDDLHIANELLGALERLYDLKLTSAGQANPHHAGVSSEEMLREYAQMKHWQRLLNSFYGDKER